MEKNIKSIKRLSVTDQAINSIKEYLLSGSIKAGDKLMTENELSKRLNVGRSTVREAIRTLQAMGYIEIIPGKGAFALVDSPESEKMLHQNVVQWFVGNELKLRELQEVRYCIEPYAAKLAAMRRSEESLLKMKDILNSFNEAYRRKKLTDMIAYEKAFHVSIIKESGNQILFGIYKQIANMFEIYSTKSFELHGAVMKTSEEHERIYKAIAAGDPQKAEKEMLNHLDIATDKMMQTIKTKSNRYI